MLTGRGISSDALNSKEIFLFGPVVSARWLPQALSLALLLIFFMPTISWAHGFAGKSFFPTTFAVEDPFVSDELSLLFNYIKEPGEEEEPPVKASTFSLEYSKRITPRLGISIGEEYLPPGRFGPEIEADVVFPVAGNYKVFSQVNHEGKVLLFDFMVRVQ